MELIKTICDLYQLGPLKTVPVVISAGRVWRVQTEQGCYAVKQLAANSVGLNNFLQGDKIANAFANKMFSVCTALAYKDKKICEINNNKFAVFKWRFGCILSAGAVTSAYAYSIGRLLADLHITNITLPEVTISRWQNYQLNDWQEFKRFIKCKKNTNLIHYLTAKLNLWAEKYFTAKANLTNFSVISHGDLTQANVVLNKHLLSIIDWEAAGYIHPQIELVGVLLNWSGINFGKLKQESFTNIIKGYRAAGGEININETVLWASLGSWFAWLDFNVQLIIFSKKNTELEVIHTVKILRRLTELFPLVLTWLENN